MHLQPAIPRRTPPPPIPGDKQSERGVHGLGGRPPGGEPNSLSRPRRLDAERRRTRSFVSPMRVLVLGAGGPFRTEASLTRALATLGHSATVVDALGWRRRLGPLAPPFIRWQVDRYEPDSGALHPPRSRRWQARTPRHPRRPPLGVLVLRRALPAAGIGNRARASDRTYLRELRVPGAGLPRRRERSRRTSCLKDWTRCWTGPRQFRQPHTTAISRSLARGSIRGATRSLAHSASRCRLQIRGQHWRRRSARSAGRGWSGARDPVHPGGARCGSLARDRRP